MQPINALVFVLDGILLGAGDAAYLAWAMVGALVAFGLAAVVVVVTDGGLLAIWAALCVLMLARLVGMGVPLRPRAAGRSPERPRRRVTAPRPIAPALHA